MIYALDSNIISYLLRDDDAVYSKYFEAAAHGSTCVIPLIVYYEVRRGLKANDANNKLRSFEELCLELGVDDLTVDDVETAADIYAERKKNGAMMNDNDLLIAAQAVTHDYTLVTHNVRHFDGIEGLKLEDWAVEK